MGVEIELLSDFNAINLVVISAPLDFSSSLAVDTSTTHEASHGVPAGASLDAVAISSLATQKEERNAGEEASQKTIKESTLAKIIGVAIDEAGVTERTAAT